MVASSILPIAWKNNKMYFLFGKECPSEDSSKGFSDFGGGVESGESLVDAAMREGSEELTGFLGDGQQLKKLISNNGGMFTLNYTPLKISNRTVVSESASTKLPVTDTYHIHIFKIEYDENLPTYYNNNHAFLWKKMNTEVLRKTKLFEKIEIGWFTIDQMMDRKREFRDFYRDIIDTTIVPEIQNIRRFLSSRKTTGKVKGNATRKTKKSRN
jgi:hypothetical protein